MKNTKRDETFLRETRHVIERHIELYPKCEPDEAASSKRIRLRAFCAQQRDRGGVSEEGV